MKIVQLKYIRRRSTDEIHVVLDDASTVALDAELAVRFQLKSGMELLPETLETLQNEQNRLQARRRLVKYLSVRKKSVREARVYLERLGFDENAVEHALDGVRELGLLDDARYAESYVRTQEKTSRKGPLAIRQELLTRGVDKSTARESTAHLDSPETQRERACEAARRKLASTGRDKDPRKARLKLYSYLLRQGYEAAVASEITRELLGEEEEL